MKRNQEKELVFNMDSYLGIAYALLGNLDKMQIQRRNRRTNEQHI